MKVDGPSLWANQTPFSLSPVPRLRCTRGAMIAGMARMDKTEGKEREKNMRLSAYLLLGGILCLVAALIWFLVEIT